MLNKLMYASAFAGLTVAAAPSVAQVRTVEREPTPQVIVERQTVPYARAVERRPLTSDQFSTTSSRLIDARRGFRPYALDGHPYHGAELVVYRDTFGIIRPDPRLLPPRQPRTGVTTFTAASVHAGAESEQTERPTIVIRIIDERGNDARGNDAQSNDEQGNDAAAKRDEPNAQPGPDMTVRVHRDQTALPSRSGAVIVRSDGTVIQVGD